MATIPTDTLRPGGADRAADRPSRGVFPFYNFFLLTADPAGVLFCNPIYVLANDVGV